MNNKRRQLGAALALAMIALPSHLAHAGPDPFLGEIMMLGTNFCPRGTSEADGQLLPISQYNALFSLFGTMYGGDGRTTFALPDLRGRTPVHAGQGPGLSNYTIGRKGGREQAEVSPGDQKFNIGRPYLVIRYCVALQGIYPSRN